MRFKPNHVSRRSKRRQRNSRKNAERCGPRTRRLMCEILEDRRLLAIVNPFHEANFGGDEGEAVKALMERVGRGMAGDGGIVPFSTIQSTMEAYLGGVEMSNAVELGFHFGANAEIDHGLAAEVSSIAFSRGFAFSWSVLDNNWTISRGIELELLGALEIGAEEYISFRGPDVVAGAKLSAGYGVPIPPVSLGTPIVGPEFTADVDVGQHWTLAIEQSFSEDQFIEAVGQPSLTKAVLDVFTPYGDHWWEHLASAIPISITAGLNLLGLADFNNSPIQLLNDGDGVPEVSLTQSTSASVGLGVSIGGGPTLFGAVGVSAGVGASVSVEVSSNISTPGHDPIDEPSLPPATPGIPYTAHVGDSDGSIDNATRVGFGATYSQSIDPAGDVDWYAFDLASPDTIGVTFQQAGDLDAELMLYDDTGALKAWSHGCSFTPELSAGSYRLAVSSYGSHTTGTYTLKLSQVQEGDNLTKTGDRWEDGDADDDGVMEAGEGVRTKVRLRSSEAIQNVDATLTTDDLNIYITEPEVYYDHFSAGETQWCVGWFDMDLNFTLAPGETRTSDFTMQVTYDQDGVPYFEEVHFTRTFYWQGDHGAFAFTGSYEVDDSPSLKPYNNGDGIIQSGEDVDIRPLLQYSGLADATIVDVALGYSGPAGDFDRVPTINNYEPYPDMRPGDSAYPEGTSEFGIQPNRRFAGTAYFDAKIVWEEAADPLVLSNALEITVEPAPWLSLSEDEWDFGLIAPGEELTYTLSVRNGGTAAMQVTGFDLSHPGDTSVDATNLPWTLQPGDPPRDVQITIDTSAVESGRTIERMVTVVSPDGRYDDPEDIRIVITGLVADSDPHFEVPGATSYEMIDVHGDMIVWAEPRFSDWDIFAYDLVRGEEFEVCTVSGHQDWPKIGDNLIAWREDGDIYAWYFPTGVLSEGTQVTVATDAAKEDVVGVDGTVVGFARIYDPEPSNPAYGPRDLWLYDAATATMTPVPGFIPGESLVSPVWHADFGDGVLTWVQGTYSSVGQHSNERVMKYEIGVDSTPVEISGMRPHAGPRTNNGKIVWTEDPDYPLRDRIWLWQGGPPQVITADDAEYGGSNLAVGNGVVAFNKQGIQALLAKDLATGDIGQFFDERAVSDSLRMDGSLAVWTSTSSKLIYAFLNQPDIAVASASLTFSDEDPFEGDSIDVSIIVNNLTDYNLTDDITVRLYDGDPDVGGTQIGTDQVISGGLTGDTERAVQFLGVTVPENTGGAQEQAHQIYVRTSMPEYDNPDNNTAFAYLSVRDNDTLGPIISNVVVAEHNGDGDGIIGADEQFRIAWSLSDASGISSTQLWVDVDGDGLGAPGARDGDDEVSLDGEYFATLGPLGAGEYRFAIDATDSDNSPTSSQFEDTFEVVTAEELTILHDGSRLEDGMSTIEFGTWMPGSPNVSKLFIVRNDGEQALALGALSVPAGFTKTDPASSIILPGSSTYFTVTLDCSVLGTFGDGPDDRVSLANGDSDRSPDGLDENPFDFTINGAVVEAFALIEMSLVRQPTAFDDQDKGEVGALPSDEEWIDEWASFYVEVWVSTPDTNDTGVLSAQLDLTYNTDYFTATAIEYGPGFDLLRVGTIDDSVGLVDGLGAGTLSTDVGDDRYALLARVSFEPTEENPNVIHNADGKYITRVDNGFGLDDPEVMLVGPISAPVELGDAPDTELWPVMYDIDDDGRNGFGDFAFFATAFQQNVGDPGATYAWAADFDHSGRVDFGDFAWFATNFQRTKTGGIPLDYHQDFPEAWRPSPLLLEMPATPPQGSVALLSEDKLDPIVAEAVDRIEKSAGSEAGAVLESVTVEIVDLPGNRLGQSLDNRVWIDVDAAGYGWFIDATPGDDVEFLRRTGTDELMATLGSPARTRVDLLTTVMHELGHVLGLKHADGSGVMNALLPLSTRWLFDEDILPVEEWQNVADSWDTVDDLFRSLGNSV